MKKFEREYTSISRSEYDKIVEELHKEGYTWNNESKLADFNPFIDDENMNQERIHLTLREEIKTVVYDY